MVGLVGILNVTPDSFSDGGDHLLPAKAYAHARQMLAEGADVIDIGAESTRPGALPLRAEEEWERLKPVLPGLVEIVHGAGKKVSLDTRHVGTAARARALGINWINDVSGLLDASLAESLVGSNMTYVLMHSLGVPADPKQVLSDDADPVSELLNWAHPKIEHLEEIGLSRAQIIFDPGLGFGKTAQQSISLVKRLEMFKELGVALMLGHSRKSFLKVFHEAPAEERDIESLTVAAFAAEKGVDWLRVHNVGAHARLLNVMEGLRL